MWKKIALIVALACSSCESAEQTNDLKAVISIEISMTTADDRSDLIALLRTSAAGDETLHVDDQSAEWSNIANIHPPDTRKSIYVGVWRGKDDNDIEVVVDDGGHIGRAWVTFFRGRDPRMAAVFRKRVVAELKRRWPNALDIPVLPSGGLPLARDLQVTAGGYKIARSAASSYGLPPSSPLLVSG